MCHFYYYCPYLPQSLKDLIPYLYEAYSFVLLVVLAWIDHCWWQCFDYLRSCQLDCLLLLILVKFEYKTVIINPKLQQNQIPLIKQSQMLFRIQQACRKLTFLPKSPIHGSDQFDQSVSADQLLSQGIKPRKRTKTVCTIGPSTESPEMIVKLIDQGLSVVRLNFNHGDHEKQGKIVANVRQALSRRKSGHVSILMDLKGPTIRTGYNADPNTPITLKKGQTLQFTTDYSHKGTDKRIACSYQDLPNSTAVGKKILMADGGITTRVLKIQDNIVTTEVLNDGKIGSRKNMCLPGATINLPTITKGDENDALNFGLKQRVNFIAVSFARAKKDIDYLRKLLIDKDPVYGPYIQIISKIENHQAIRNIDQLIEASDGIMVARGDLGMEVPIEKVVLLQKFIANKTINMGKFVITATQMLESMETKPRPTRAEISDVTNSVFDFTDANMTSGETSIGLFPVETANVLKCVAQECEAVIDYKKLFERRKYMIDYKHNREIIGAVALAFELDCHFIFVKTDDIKLIGKISSLRPRAFVIVFTDKFDVKGAVAIRFGVYCYKLENGMGAEDFLKGHGHKYGYSVRDTVRILQIEAEGEKVVSTRLMRVN